MDLEETYHLPLQRIVKYEPYICIINVHSYTYKIFFALCIRYTFPVKLFVGNCLAMIQIQVIFLGEFQLWEEVGSL